MKQTKPALFTTVVKCSRKTTIWLLLVTGLYSQAVTAQSNRRGEGDRNSGGNRQVERRDNNVHQNRNDNTTRVRTTTTINRGNVPVNRVNTPANRGINTNINRTNVTVNRTSNINRTVNNRVTVNRTVNNNYHRPVYNAGNPNWRYSYLPRRNSIRTTFPTGYRTINYGGFGYRYYNGVFYRPQNNAFVVIAPPIGIFINTLPLGYRRIYVNNYPYYYYNGTYYDYRDNNYTVVSPPVGAVVESIPDGFQTVVIDGETYYTADGAQYKPVVQDNGEIWYQVIKAN